MCKMLFVATFGVALSTSAARAEEPWCAKDPFRFMVCVTGAVIGIGIVTGGGGSSRDRDDGGKVARGNDYDPNAAPPGFTYDRDTPPRVDTSEGCVWGDRAYGTCVE